MKFSTGFVVRECGEGRLEPRCEEVVIVVVSIAVVAAIIGSPWALALDGSMVLLYEAAALEVAVLGSTLAPKEI